MKAKSANGQLEVETSADLRLGNLPRILDDDERLSWLRLIRTPHIGPTTFWDLLKHFGGARAALEALPAFLREGSRISVSGIPSESAAQAELATAHAAEMRLVAVGEADYPPLLRETEYPPPLLYVKGRAGCWSRPPVAIVGSRLASAAGLKFTAQLSAELAEDGFCIVSGLARGIDAAAHRAALPFGTAAMLPGGLDNVYPPEHVKLTGEILETGIIISECAPGFQARAQDFPRRNRLISGSSLGVIVVEATEKSGSLITARLAGEQNREVFAVPGHPLDPRAAGTNRLLKEGAILATCANDIRQALGTSLNGLNDRYPAMDDPGFSLQTKQPVFRNSRQQPETEPCLEQADGAPSATTSEIVLGLLSFAPIEVDHLTRISGLQPRDVNSALLMLQLEGYVERHRNDRVSRRK